MKTPYKYRALLGAGLTTVLLASSGCEAQEKGCEKYSVYSQNRWEPLGTAIRAEPSKESEQIGSFAPNTVIGVDGWYDSGVVTYPPNPEPFDSTEWFRLSDQNGWVSFAGVRQEPTSPDPTGFGEGGMPAILLPKCEIEYLPE